MWCLAMRQESTGGRGSVAAKMESRLRHWFAVTPAPSTRGAAHPPETENNHVFNYI